MSMLQHIIKVEQIILYITCLLDTTRILIDGEEENTIQHFEPIRDCIINLIKESEPRFSIGIYGEWGTGKTTLMRSIEKKLNGDTIRWNQIPGKDSAILIEFLRNSGSFDWISQKDIAIEKNSENSRLIVSSNLAKKQLYLELKQTKLNLVDDRIPIQSFSINGKNEELKIFKFSI